MPLRIDDVGSHTVVGNLRDSRHAKKSDVIIMTSYVLVLPLLSQNGIVF